MLGKAITAIYAFLLFICFAYVYQPPLPQLLQLCALFIPSKALFVILVLYPLLALTLEPLYMDLVGFFEYPKKPGEVPTFIPIGWGVIIAVILILLHVLATLSGMSDATSIVSILILLLILILLGTGVGIGIEYFGTKCGIWKYDENKLKILQEILQKRAWKCYICFKPIKYLCPDNTPLAHVCGYPLLSLIGYFIIYVYEHGQPLFSSYDILQIIFAWISGLVVWFFGLYSFTEHEVSGAVRRFKELKKMAERMESEKIKLARIAQETVIKELKGLKRLLIIHLPGIIVGLVMPLFILLAVLARYGIMPLSLRGLLALLSLSLISLIVLCIIGTIILAHAFRKRPQARCLDVILEHEQYISDQFKNLN
jgi:hypothetical protein